MLQSLSTLHSFLRSYFHLKSADWAGNNPKPLNAWAAEDIAQMPYYYVMPLHSDMREAVALSLQESDSDPVLVSKLGQRWLSDEELEVYVSAFTSTEFQGALNWYRVATSPAHMSELELYAGKKVDVPLLYIAGKKDWGTYQEPGAVEKLEVVCTKGKFYGTKIVDGAGHWVQQEQPDRVVQLVRKFLVDSEGHS
jgi:pimeloyl-ACP methyl ester carboxylesterase